MHMAGLTDEYPWVRVNALTWDIEHKGSFREMNRIAKGHMMTETNWKLITEERGITPKDLTL
jgi:hypothetical protein